MSLDWDVGKVKDWKALQGKTESMVTDVLVWHTMSIGMGRITEANSDEFYARVNMFERVHEPSLYKEDKPRYITREEVDRRIGLFTNASNLTRAQFMKRVWERHERELRDVKRYAAERDEKVAS
jgi:hypothetical protein